MNEQAFFQNIARRLGREFPADAAASPAGVGLPAAEPERAFVGAPDFWTARQWGHRERLENFTLELGRLGGSARVYATLGALHGGLETLLRELSAPLVCGWGGEFIADMQLQNVFDSFAVVPWDDEPDMAEPFTRADVGVTGCDFAIADTGTVVLLNESGQGRLVSLLPTVHIVVLRASRIRTSMGEVWREIALRGLDPVHLPSTVIFISGPSRSSDIENDLTIGVHGPAAVHALVWDDVGSP